MKMIFYCDIYKKEGTILKAWQIIFCDYRSCFALHRDQQPQGAIMCVHEEGKGGACALKVKRETAKFSGPHPQTQSDIAPLCAMLLIRSSHINKESPPVFLSLWVPFD
jgi:hypothetical protein